MSRIGKRPVEVPKNVKVSIRDRAVAVEGPKGKLEFVHRPEVRVTWDEDSRAIACTIDPSDAENRVARALWGTTRAILRNMVQGVCQGYEKKLEIVGVGWNAAVAGQRLQLNLGFATPVFVDIPAGLTVTANKQELTIQGADKQRVGEFAAVVRSKREPEPYNGKGIKYVDEVIKRKQGKQFGS